MFELVCKLVLEIVKTWDKKLTKITGIVADVTGSIERIEQHVTSGVADLKTFENKLSNVMDKQDLEKVKGLVDELVLATNADLFHSRG